MCEVSKCQRRSFRDQDPPRIRNQENLLKVEFEVSRSTPNSPTRMHEPTSSSGLEKCFGDSEPELFRKHRLLLQRKREGEEVPSVEAVASCNQESTSSSRENNACTEPEVENAKSEFSRKPIANVRPSCENKEVITNGTTRGERDKRSGSGDGKGMAPVLGVPIPPPEPHLGPDGLILPRKPYNPCKASNNHKDLHRELLFNQKIGKNVLNQKSELQRALDKHRETLSRKEAERHQEESYKNDPRTALQRAIEQRAKHIQLAQQQQQQMQPTEPVNPLITARAKLRHMDSQ